MMIRIAGEDLLGDHEAADILLLDVELHGIDGIEVKERGQL